MPGSDAEREVLVEGRLDGYEPEIGAALWRLQEGRERTMRVLEAVPQEFVNRDVDGNAIGTIVYHVALIETDYLYSEILEQPIPDDVMSFFPVSDRDAHGTLSKMTDGTLRAHQRRLETVRARLVDALRGMTTAEFHRPRQLAHYDMSAAYVLHHLAQHEAEHRSEIDAVANRLRRSEEG